MAPPKKKAGGQPRKQQIIRRCCINRQYRKRPDIARREMVYRLLNDKHNQVKAQNKASGSQRDRYHGRMRKYQNTREYSYDSSLRRDSSPSIDDTEYTKSVATSVENLSMDVANSSAASSSENSSVSNVSVEPIVLAKSIDNTRALLKKKSLVQVINNYIKAGIEEGKRQAKKYIRKALSFGVKSGYLIPTDPQGQVIRVSPTLIKSKRSDAESRKKRKRARRGEEDPTPDNREHHQTTPPWNTERKRITRREDTPRPETPPRKRRRTTKNSSQARKNSRKRRGPVERVPRDGKKKRNARKRTKDKLIISMLSNVPSNKSDENVLKNTRRTRSSHKCDVDEKKEGRRDRRAKSPRAGNEDNENSNKNNEDSSNEDADSAKFSDSKVNERTPIRRRKSTTSREDASRNGDPSLADPVRIVEEKLDAPNEENNENNAIGNI